MRSGWRSTINWNHLILGMKKTTKDFLENVLENIIESIVVTNLDGYLVFFNKYSEEMFGFQAGEVLNRHVVILGAREPDVLAYIRRKETYDGEIILRTKAGRSFPAHVRCVPLCDEQDLPIAMVGVARDLTREKEKERIDREIARLESFNKNIIACLNDGIQIINLDGIITFVNKRLEVLLGYGPGELIGMHYSTVVLQKDHFRFNRLIDLKSVLEEGESSFESSLLTKTGKRVLFWVSTSPLLENSIPVGIVAAVTDISEVQSLKEELFQSEKMSLLGTLASEVAHEINNPLGGLIMSVQMLLEDLESGDLDASTAALELREIENDARRCKRITQKLLDFSRRVPEERVLLDLTGIVEDALVLVQRQAELENISFTKRYAENLPNIRGNCNSLEQVIINIVKNARDAMPDGGDITITTDVEYGRNRGPSVWVSIADTGPGIPPHIADNLFDPFVTTKQGGQGTGLGLAVSKRIVEDHGGHIRCENRAGRGAIFYIHFPAIKRKE
ncbi:MAG: PAS domain S-box protein [Deltaproteobacteria bacterium]|nr:PAS domain S-box protein [Deltaproteobacteria bacterium]